MKRTFAITVAAVVFILDSTQAQEFKISGDDLGKRIVNGKDATAHSWPWMVSLEYNGQHICGGSLIKVNWVVTAAHCVEGYIEMGHFRVVVGSHDRTDTTQFQRSYRLRDIIIHEGYHKSHFRNDIALLQLEESIHSSTQVNVVSLPDAGNRVEPGKMCYITGWGRTVGGGDTANILQEALLPVADINACSRLWGSFVDDRTMLCAGGEGIAGGCQGDSGGSFVCEENGRFVLRGVVSWGHRNCRTDHFSVFARVSSLIDWINERTSDCIVKTTQGKCCVFPFTYGGKVYQSCTTENHDKPWCSTTANYDQDGQWGNCLLNSS